MEAMSEHLNSNPHCESASRESASKTKEAENAQHKPFRCSDCDFSCMLRGNLKNHIQRKHCISEDGSGNNTKKKGRGATKDATRGRRGRGGRRGNMAGEGPPFCLRSHHCPLCNVSFVREDSWRSHIRQHQTKGEGLEIPLGPMMPSLVDSSEAAIISTIEETPCSESPGDSLISLPEEEQNNKLIGGRPFIITFEGNDKSQVDQGNCQGETEMMSEFAEPSSENHSVLLYVQADQEANQNQDDDENLRSGAEILASLNQSIPVSCNSSLSSNTKPIAIAPAPSSSQQHTILLAASQPSAHTLKGHITTGSANTCQYIALPNEQTAIMDQLTAALQPGLQYMISGPLEAIMALPSALEQRQMTVTSENQKAVYENSVISLQLNHVKEESEMKED
ncbi:hypothetical protein J437_LFUL000346 [Ladona fulva]|uniref:C2H2-type domain-containing protein n=1 Tax=Ladona fulva TaxID=123851 RepID=A0A8K0JV09_LADFU|nr:hypothetical protein J437_LFUL000346 [Ladona fulva]